MKTTFEFLTKLKKNNTREWFAANKPEFDEIVKENKVFFTAIYTEFQKHDELSGIHIYRIYKDIRFSKDKTPYKTNLGVDFQGRSLS
jgi:uncharacterized protein (TIGR02453 family)